MEHRPSLLKLIILAGLLLPLAACVEVRVGLHFNSAGGGHIDLMFIQLPEGPFWNSKEQAIRELELSEEVQKGQMQVRDGVENGRRYLSVSTDFTDPSQITPPLKRVFGQDFSLSFERTAGGDCDVFVEGLPATVSAPVSFAITMPGKILKSDPSGRVQGNSIEWTPAAGQRFLYVRSEASEVPWNWLFLVLVLAVGGAGLYLSRQRVAALAARRPHQVFCTQCGGQQEAGTKFCTQCGERLS